MLDKFTKQRGLSELEHYRLQLSIGVASIVFFGILILVSIGFALFAKMSRFDDQERVLTGLFVLLVLIFLTGIWESNVFKAIKYWSAASPINRAALQQRIDDLEQALTQNMAKRFGWGAKP